MARFVSKLVQRNKFNYM